MKAINKLHEWVFILFHPSFWIMDKKFNARWDSELNNLISTDRFTGIDQYYASIGNHRLYIANYPYYAFVIDTGNPFIGTVRPGRYTIYRARQKLIHDYYSDVGEG